jgi:DNA-binding response OmpR family regulator
MADLLIIDDDLDSADALSEIMRAHGHDVRVGYNGREGLRLVSERIPDLALLDVEMPLLGGPASLLARPAR